MGNFTGDLLPKTMRLSLEVKDIKTMQGANDGIASVRKNAPLDERYKRLVAKNGEYYFVLMAANHKIIGVSETYKTKASREKGIEAVKREAPIAVIEDLTEQDQKQKEEASEIGIAETAGGLTILPSTGNGNSLSVKPKGGVYGEEPNL